MAGIGNPFERGTYNQGQKRILSDAVRIRVRDRDGKTIRVGEFDSFSATKKETLRSFKPVGELREVTLVIDSGWELSFSGGKVDWNLARIMAYQEAYMHPNHSSEVPVSLFNPQIYEVRNIHPLYDVEHTTHYYDGSKDTYVYEEVTLYNFSTQVDGDLQEVKESVKGYSPRRKLMTAEFVDDIFQPTAQYVVESIITDIQRTYFKPTK